jgi:hypothetical protein
VQAKRVQSRLTAASSLLPAGEARVLELAMQLGRIYHHVDDLPLADTRKQIELKVKNLSPPASAVAIKKKFAAAARLSSGYDGVQRIGPPTDRK